MSRLFAVAGIPSHDNVAIRVWPQIAGMMLLQPSSSHDHASPHISIITPTYNERSNLRALISAIDAAMAASNRPARTWEVIVVDDDSPDGTYDEAQALAREGLPVRCVRRIGRRGLASAVIEGALTSHAELLAVIDADLQHDERLLPRMVDLLDSTDCDVVIGSRYVEGGGLGELAAKRQRMSKLASRCSRLLVGSEIADPMSGFFAVRSAVFYAGIYSLSQQGYKILLDLLASSPRKLKIVELPYIFRSRRSGESKLDTLIVLEFLFLLVEKLSRGLIPPKLVLFCAVGGMGLFFHLTLLRIMQMTGFAFLPAQTIATYCAMTLNYVVNNALTYRSERLRGTRFLWGYLGFCAICSVGALANISVAKLALSEAGNWTVAGFAGVLMGAVFNFGAVTQLIWRRRRPRPPAMRTAEGRLGATKAAPEATGS